MKSRKLFFYLFLLAGISLVIYCLGRKVSVDDIVHTVERAGFWAPVLYVFILALTYVIAPLSGTPVWFAGYLLFDKKVQILGYFAALLGAIANFWIARKFGRGVVSKFVGEKSMDKIDQFTEEYGVKSLIFLRLLQGQFHDFIAYAYGLTSMKFVPYFVISVLTPIPWLLLWYFYILNRVENLGDFAWWFFITIAPLYIVSIFLFRKLKEKRSVSQS